MFDGKTAFCSRLFAANIINALVTKGEIPLFDLTCEKMIADQLSTFFENAMNAKEIQAKFAKQSRSFCNPIAARFFVCTEASDEGVLLYLR